LFRLRFMHRRAGLRQIKRPPGHSRLSGLWGLSTELLDRSASTARTHRSTIIGANPAFHARVWPACVAIALAAPARTFVDDARKARLCLHRRVLLSAPLCWLRWLRQWRWRWRWRWRLLGKPGPRKCHRADQQ
jgi:hypothetical protein